MDLIKEAPARKKAQATIARGGYHAEGLQLQEYSIWGQFAADRANLAAEPE